MSRADKPVYPYQPLDGSGMPKFEAHSGISLLEHYAGLAMQGLIAHNNREQTRGTPGVPLIAKFSVEYARALIAELDRAQEQNP